MNGPRWKQRVLAADRWLRTRPMGVQIGVCYLMFMAVAFVFGLVKLAIDQVTGVWFSQSIDAMSVGLQLFGAVLLAPAFETWVAQSLILDDLAKVRFFGARPRLVFALSTLCFGLQHFYSLGYIVYGCAGGAVLAYTFLATGRRARGYGATALVHAAWNLTVFFLRNFG